MPDGLREPSGLHPDVDRAEDGRAVDAELVSDRLVAGIAATGVFEAVQANPHQHKPMNDADALIVGDAAQPIEAVESLLAHDCVLRSRDAGMSSGSRSGCGCGIVVL